MGWTEAPSPEPAGIQQAEAHRASGKSAFEKRDFGAARAAFSSGLQCLDWGRECWRDAQTPETLHLAAVLLSNRGLCAGSTGDWEAARADGLAALDTAGPDQTDLACKAGFRTAQACLMLGDVAGADRAATRAGLDPAGGADTAHLLARIRALQDQETVQHGASFDATHGASAGDVAEELRRVTAALEAEMDGEEGVDVEACLLELQRLIATRDRLTLLHSLRLEALLAALFPGAPSAVARVLRVATTADGRHVCWPARTLRRLRAAAVSARDAHSPAEIAAAAEAMSTLRWALQTDAWLADRGTRLGGPCEGLDQGLLDMLADDAWVKSVHASLLQGVLELLSTMASLCRVGVERVMPTQKNRDACAVLLHLFHELPDTAAAQPATSVDGVDVGNLPPSEVAALRQLQVKRAQVYSPKLAELRRATLCTLRSVLESTAGPRPTALTLQGLVRLVRGVHQTSPKRLAAVPDGMGGMRYEQRRFAADYADNPWGDYLLHMDLPGAAPLPNPEVAPPLLVTALCTLCSALDRVRQPPAPGALAELVPLIQELTDYVDGPRVAELALQACRRACQISSVVRSRALASDDVGVLAAALSVASAATERGEAAQKLITRGALSPAVVHALWPALGKESACDATAAVGSPTVPVGPVRDLALKCLAAAQGAGGLGPETWPSGDEWEAATPALRAKLLAVAAERARTVVAESKKDGLAGLGKGFLAAHRSVKPGDRPEQSSDTLRPAALDHFQPAKQTSQASAPGINAESTKPDAQTSTATQMGPPPKVHTYRHGSVTLQEIDEDDNSLATSAPASSNAEPEWRTPPGDSTDDRLLELETLNTTAGLESKGPNEDNDGIEELRDVYDSGAIDPAVRQRRSAWLSLSEDKRSSWSQTSSDVFCTFALPAGTRPAEIAVEVEQTRLAVRLRWYGRLLDVELWAGVKSVEATWCLEGAELQVLLPKASPGWWKALSKGGQERSYHELLHEAVHADEPVTAYDELDDDAKDLIDAIRERQAYIAAGMLDPEGFDDFRVVIGENGLRG